ncbi:MAG: lipoate--protein ligase [Peptostreptococcaceae bacterium]|nr:lipoate--protein ligase [Peptostreptococcaceae bacterium]
MINIINNSKDSYFNLALEEYFLKIKDLKEDLIILWQNDPTIVIGKNQNTYEELNIDYVERNHINVVRRLSGGGAVYHDSGNLNYTIIKNDGNLYKNDFRFFALPVVSCLKKLRIEATFNGRNDILIEGKKFSGNAQYFYNNKVLHHGTLLFSSDLSILAKALHVKEEKLESKGIKSVKSRVTNIADYLKKEITLNNFQESLIISMFEENEAAIKNYNLTDDDILLITQLRDSKYSTWEWNFGESPKMTYQKQIRTNAGSLTLTMEIKNGYIEKIRIQGDFFEVKPVEELENIFMNKKYENAEIETLLYHINVSDYIYLLSNDDFKMLLFN